MDDLNADAKGSFRRVEVLTGPARRRQWSAAEKARIVSETLMPGVTVSAVARRWQVSSQQVFTWRREARCGQLVLPAETVPESMPDFVPIVVEAPPASPHEDGANACVASERTVKASAKACIEIRLAGAVIRLVSGSDCALLAEVLRALRKSAA